MYLWCRPTDQNRLVRPQVGSDVRTLVEKDIWAPEQVTRSEDEGRTLQEETRGTTGPLEDNPDRAR